MSRFLRILFAADVPPNPNSGAAGTEYQTVQALREMGQEVDTIWAEDLPHRIKHWNLHYLLELPRAYWTAISYRLRTQAYDVIHVNQGHCFWAAKQYAQSEQKGVFVHRSHGLDDHLDFTMDIWNQKLGVSKRRGLKQYSGRLVDYSLHRHDRLAAKYVDGTIVGTSIDEQFLQTYHNVDKRRIAVIPQAPPVYFQNHSVKPISSDRLRKVLYIGSAVSKGIHTVAAVINQCVEQKQGIQFTWICPAQELLLCESLLTSDARATVNFIDWIEQEKLLDVYDQHGILLVPSLFEGFSKAFLEGMSRGLIVISTRVGGMNDILQNDENGCFVGLNDVGAIVQRLLFVSSHLEMAKRVAENARETSLQFSWKRVASETLTFYENLLAEK